MGRRIGAIAVAWLVAALLAFGMVQPAWAQLTAQSLREQSVACMPDVTEDMLNASYWSAKQQDPAAVQANRAEIDAINQAGVDGDGTALQPLRTANARFYNASEQLRVKASVENDLAYFMSEGARDADGNLLASADATAIANLCPTDGAAPAIASGYAVVTKHTTMRSVPTDRAMRLTPGDADDDNLYIAALRVNEPLLVREQSTDGNFYLCTSSFLPAAWVPASDIAICKDRAEWLAAWDVPAGKELVVTGYKVRTEQSNQTPNIADRMLYMGTVLERFDIADPKEALGLVGTRSAYYNHVCYLPVRNVDGTYSRELALIAASADVSEGYLPLTKENIARQAFKSLGQMYGWGGMLEADDCSGYVRNVYKCFGLELPLNTTMQPMMPVRGYDLSALDDAHKAAAIAQMPLGTVLYWGTHEMIYLGQENGKLYVISSLGVVGDMYGDTYRSNQIKGVSVNTLDTVRANRATWLSMLTYANVPYVSASQQGPALNDIAFYGAGISWPQGSYTFTGKAFEPAVSVAGLVKGTDYEVAYADNVQVGTATVTVSGKGAYSGTVKNTFEIGKASQTISAKNKSKKFTASKKTKALAKNKTVKLKTFAKVSAKTKVTYAKANTVGGKKIVVAKKTGVVMAKKGLKKGTYKVKVKLTAAASASYEKAKAKTITLTIKVV